MGSGNPVVEIRKASKHFDSVKALDEVDLDIYEGSIIGLLGANGAGKSTLLRHIVGLYLPDSGTCRTLGCETAKLGAKEFARIGYVHQEGRLIDFMRVRQLIDYVKAFYESWDDALEQAYTKDFDIKVDELVGNLSPGERQRLSVLLAVCFKPELLILDEPVAALDPLAREQFLDLLLEMIQTEGRTIIISSHILSDVEKVIDHVLIMKKGRIICDCSFDELREQFSQMRLRSIGGKLPIELGLSNVRDFKRSDNEAVVVVEGYLPDELEAAVARLDCEVEIEPLTLEKLYRIIVTQ